MEREEKIAFNEALRSRTKLFALRVIKLFQALPKTGESQILGKQLVRSATSVAANYRAVCRSRSKAEFTSKMSIVIEESDESVFWIEMLIESKIITERKLASLLKEANELTAIFASTRKTLTKTK